LRAGTNALIRNVRAAAAGSAATKPRKEVRTVLSPPRAGLPGRAPVLWSASFAAVEAVAVTAGDAGSAVIAVGTGTATGSGGGGGGGGGLGVGVAAAWGTETGVDSTRGALLPARVSAPSAAAGASTDINPAIGSHSS